MRCTGQWRKSPTAVARVALARITRCEAHAEGDPVPAAPGRKNLRIHRMLVDGKLRIVAAHRYDRARDAFVEIPTTALEDD
jgi:hypothetical protein